MPGSRILLSVVLMAFFVWPGNMGAGAHAAAAHHTLFSGAGAEQEALPKDDPIGAQFAEKRARVVEVSPTLAAPGAVRAGDVLTLNLFDDTEYRATVDRVTTHVNGAVSVRARVWDTEYGFVILSTFDGRTIGTIEIPDTGAHFHIQSGPDAKTHYLLDLDMAAQAAKSFHGPCCSVSAHDRSPHPVIRDASEAVPKAAIKSTDPLDPAFIDLMIVYTPAAREWADTFGGGIEVVISHVMERIQLVLDNSGVQTRMPLVHAAEVDYTESDCAGVDLQRITVWEGLAPFEIPCGGEELQITGFMNEVHEWRDEYGADLVVFLPLQPGTGGIAFLPDTPAGQPAWAYSLTNIQFAASTFIAIHEIGHSLGASHHKEQNAQPGPGLFPYAAGWRWTGEHDIRYASVMTYEEGVYFTDGLRHGRVPHFSNPDIAVGGVPSGHPDDGDNARVIREMKHVIAAYRPSAYDHFVVFETDSAPQTAIDGEAFQGLATGETTTPVTAIGPPSWIFSHWSLDGAFFSDDNPIVVENVTADMVLVAEFDVPQVLHTAFGGWNTAFGNMFDIEVTEPVLITGFDVNLTRPASTNTLALYLREGSSFGAENSSDGWELRRVDNAVVSRGDGMPTHVDAGGWLLLPGQTYGVFIHLANSDSNTRMLYRSGDPVVFSTPEISLRTNCAKGEGGFTGSTVFPRRWSGSVYYVPVEPPVALSIEPVTPNPTNATSVDFAVGFSVPVVNFEEESDLIIEHNGTAHDSVSISGSGAAYTVAIGGITGEGSFTLEVSTEGGIEDEIGQPLIGSVTSAPMVIDHTPPNVSDIVPATTGPTNAASVTFTVTFDEAVRGIDPETDLLIVHDGTSHGSASVEGANSVYTVTVEGIDGDGSFTLAIDLDGQVQDLAGNPLATSVTSAPVLIDNTPPAPPAILTDFGNGPGEDFTTSIAQFELTGTADDDTAEILVNGESVTHSLANGQWSVVVDLETFGPDIVITAVDLAGNESVASSITIAYDPDHDADGDGLTDQEELELAALIPADPLDPLLPRSEWHVSAAMGDDAVTAINGGGTDETPWRSITFAMEQLAPLAREQFPLRILLDDTPAGGDGSMALYEEPNFAFLPFVRVEAANTAGGPVHIRQSTAGSSPFIEAAAGSSLHGVTILPAGPQTTLLRIAHVPFTVERVIFDGGMLQGSIGIHIEGADSSASRIWQSRFVSLGTGIRSIHTSPFIADNSFENITANGAASRSLAIRFTMPSGGKQSAVTPVLGLPEQITHTGFNRFRGIEGGARAIVFLDAPFDFTSALYNDWGVYTEAEIRALIFAPTPGGVDTVFVSPFIPADKAIAAGGVTGLILDAVTHQPIPLQLGPGVETGQDAFEMAGMDGVFSFAPGVLPPGMHELTAKAQGYADSDPVAVVVGEDNFEAPRFLLDRTGAPQLAVNPLQLSFTGSGGGRSVAIANSGTGFLHWEAAATQGADWFSLQSQDDTLVITATANPGPGPRTATVTISSVNATNGPIQITVNQDVGGIAGDVNGDGVVNAVDVQLVINAALGIEIDPSFTPDINGDGVVNAVDVQLVTNAALGVDIG